MKLEARLKRLKIHKYRNIAPGTELVFNDGFNVLLGRNGSGKTTLLKLIDIVTRSAFSTLRDTNFSIEYEIAFLGLSARVSIRNSIAREPETSSEYGPFLGASRPTASRDWYYKITIQREGENLAREIEASPLGAFARRGDDGQGVPTSIIDPFSGHFLTAAMDAFAAAIPDETHHQQTPIVALMASMFLYLNGARFDEALARFTALLRKPDNRPATRIRLESKSGGPFTVQTFSGIPVDIWARLEAATLQEPGAETVTIPSSDLPFLKRVVDLLGFERADLTLRLFEKDVSSDSQVLTYSGLGFSFTMEDGAIIHHNLLSYGQKRLLSFFYYAAGTPIVIADELVNGLHYDWIESCLDELEGRQSFLTSQNPILLDFLPFESADDVQQTFILCSREVQDKHSQMVWRNMNEEEAEGFYRAYRTKAQQVSEILRSKGLW